MGAFINKFDGVTFINNLFCGQQSMIVGPYENRSLSDRATSRIEIRWIWELFRDFASRLYDKVGHFVLIQYIENNT